MCYLGTTYLVLGKPKFVLLANILYNHTPQTLCIDLSIKILYLIQSICAILMQ
jgi:hypothetical protein